MANLWQLPDSALSSKASPGNSAQVEILSISIVDLEEQRAREIIAGEIGSGQIAPPTPPVSSALVAPTTSVEEPETESANPATQQIVNTSRSLDSEDVKAD